MKKIIRITSIFSLLIIFIGIIYYAVSTSKFNFEKADSPRSYKTKTSKGIGRDVQVRSSNPTMVSLGSYTTNMSRNGKAGKFVITELSARTDDEDASYELKDKNILVRDIIIKEMSLKTFSQISSPRGKEQLKNNIQSELNRILGEGNIEEVYFTKFLVQ